jgi:hypothetical protein
MGDEEHEASAKTEDRVKSPAGEPEAGMETQIGARAGTSARPAEKNTNVKTAVGRTHHQEDLIIANMETGLLHIYPKNKGKNGLHP